MGVHDRSRDREKPGGCSTKLAYLSEFVDDGGTTTAFARRTKALARNLSSLGVEVILVTDEPERTAGPTPGIRLTRLPTPRRASSYMGSVGLRLFATLAFAISFWRFLRQTNADVILLTYHEPLHALCAMVAAKLHDKPTIFDAQDSWLVLEHEHSGRLRNSIRKSIERRAMLAADVITTVTPTLKQIICANYRLGPQRLQVVYNGADLPPELKPRTKDIDVIHLGSPRKYYATLAVIEAFGAPTHPGRDPSLAFIGCTDEPYVMQVKKRAEELGLSSRFSFLPPVPPDEVGEWLARAKIALHTMGPDPIYRCAIGVKVFEYLAHGLPVVHLGPMAGETARLITNGGCGVVVDSPERIPAAVASLLEDESRRSALSESARLVAAQYTWRQSALTMASVVRQLGRP